MMRKRFLTILIGLCVVVAVGCLSGCNSRRAAHYDYLVTFNYNTAHLQLSEKYDDQYLGAMAGQRIMQPTKEDSDNYGQSRFKELQIKGYAVQGWYTAQYDQNGNVVKNEDGSVALGRPWNFATDVVTENLTLYAQLVLKPTIHLMYGDEEIAAKSFLIGREVAEKTFMRNDPKVDGHTFYDYYADKALTERFVFPIVMGEEDITIYARFIKGENWNIVSTAQEFASAYRASAKIYVDTEVSKELDFTGVAFTPRLEFGGEINGNGAVLKNISCVVKQNNIRDIENLALFGTLLRTANIHDITFANVQVTVKVFESKVPIPAALFAYKIVEGAKVTNVTVSGVLKKEGDAAALQPICVSGEQYIGMDTCDFSNIEVIEDTEA